MGFIAKLFICSIIFLLMCGFVQCSLETTISQRASVRTFSSSPVSTNDLKFILQSSYGYYGSNRVLPNIGSTYSLVIFAINNTGSYRYNPTTNSLLLHDSDATKETIRPHNSNWPSDADVVLVVVWDQTTMNNQYFASLEAGCLTQNLYLASVSKGLGTCAVGILTSAGLRTDLNLSTNMIPLLVFPIGYPTYSYPNATPNFDTMTGNLPVVQDSAQSLTQALNKITITQNWNSQELSPQKRSQLLWAAYGFTSTNHRTTPSATGVYPLIIYTLNLTGTYQYYPQNHSTTKIQSIDKRNQIAAILDNQDWLANAPELFLVTVNTSHNSGNIGDGGAVDHEWINVNAGCVIQQIILEGAVQDLATSVVSQGLEVWNGAGAQLIQTELGLISSIIPLSIIGVGTTHPTPTPTLSPTATPTSSPTPTPTLEPTLTPTPSLSPTPTPSPTPSISPSPTPQPTQTPKPESGFPTEYIVAGITVIAVIGLAIFLLRRK